MAKEIHAMLPTKCQGRVLNFVSNFSHKNGYPPSYEEIAKGLGLASLATVHKHVEALEKKGLIRRGFNRARSLHVVADDREELIKKLARARRERDAALVLLAELAL